MLAVILKDLHCYVNSRRYRRIQFIVLCVLSLLLFVAAVEFYAYRRTVHAIDVGQQTYVLFIIAIFVAQFWMPRHAVEAMATEHLAGKCRGENRVLLALTPLANWQILAGKLTALVFWALWNIWLTVPLLALSSYIGGLALSQWMKCSVVLLVSSIFFALVGITVALQTCPTRAKGISYGVILLLTFCPFTPFSLFEAMPMLAAISPLSTLLSILRADLTHLWLWNIGMFCGASTLMFALLIKRMPL